MRRVLFAIVGWTASAGTTVAHTGHPVERTGTGTPALSFALILAGGGIAATSLYLEQTGSLEGKNATVGLLLGVTGVLAGVVLGLWSSV